jgi:hypothetical protein
MNNVISRAVHAMSTRHAAAIIFVLFFCARPDEASAQTPRSCLPPDSTAGQVSLEARPMPRNYLVTVGHR